MVGENIMTFYLGHETTHNKCLFINTIMIKFHIDNKKIKRGKIYYVEFVYALLGSLIINNI